MDIGRLFRDAWGLFVKDIGPLIAGMLIASIVPAVAAVVIGAATLGASISDLQTNAQGDVTGVGSMDWALLIIGSVAIVVVTLVLTVPLYVGVLSGVLRRVRHGRQMAYGDAFAGFGMFGRVIWAAVLVGLTGTAILVAPTALIVGGAVAGSAILIGLGVLALVAAGAACAYLGVCWVYLFPVIVDRDLGVTSAMGESRRLVHGAGWWWTFLVLFVLQLVGSAVSFALGLLPVIGWIASIVVSPFVLTYIVAMYFQARGEGRLVDGALGRPGQAPSGPPAYTAQATPYGTPPAPPMPTYDAPSPVPSPPAEQGHAYAPAAPPLTTPARSADESHETAGPAPQTAVTRAAAPEPPAQPATPEAPLPPEPPSGHPGA